VKFYEFVEQALARQAAGENIAKLYIGEPDMNTPQTIVDAGLDSMGKTNATYVSAQGLPALRKMIAQKHRTTAEQIVLTPGSKFAIFGAVRLLAQGKKVCILSPHWPGFDSICAANNAKPVHVKSALESNWAWDAADLDAAIDSDTKLVVICNPNNPTSTVLSSKKVNELAGVASAHGVPVLVDTAYQGLSFSKMDDQTRPSENVIVAGSFSKGFAMTGWRAGYLASGPEFAQRMVSLAQSTFSCVPQFVQDAAICAMHNPQIETQMARAYEERAKIASDILSKKFEFARPQAGIYIFVTKKGLDGDKTCMELLDKGIGVAPGSAFGFPEFLRISLTLPQDELACALEKINKLV